MFDRVLVVCVGNICRSPTAERLLRRYAPNCQVDSAGVQALVGQEADATAQKIAAVHGVDVSGHTARQLDANLCAQYDLILVMEQRHIESVNRICPSARGKTMLFAYWLPEKNVADPYKKSEEAFEAVFQQLDLAAQAWASKLS